MLISPAHFARANQSRIGHDNCRSREESGELSSGQTWLRVGEQRYFERATASPIAMSKSQAHWRLNSGSRHLTEPSGRGGSRSAVKAVRPASSLHGVDRQRRAKSASTSAPPAI